eukprot:scaffold322257_cov18-Tisochrysis_lutea.AAC.1
MSGFEERMALMEQRLLVAEKSTSEVSLQGYVVHDCTGSLRTTPVASVPVQRHAVHTHVPRANAHVHLEVTELGEKLSNQAK